MTERNNCVICHTYYDGMLDKLGESFCIECWDIITELVREELKQQ